MKNLNAVNMLILIMIVLFLSGCLTEGVGTNTNSSSASVACGDSYEKIKRDEYVLSEKATKKLEKKLKKMNEIIAEDEDSEVRLASCNRTITMAVKGKIDKEVVKLCGMDGLSKKEVEDCNKTACTSQMETEWCEDLEAKITSLMKDACGQFEFNVSNCNYSQKSEEK